MQENLKYGKYCGLQKIVKGFSVEIIRIYMGADRRFCPEGHCLGSQGFDSFSCIPFNFECFISLPEPKAHKVSL